MKDLWEYITTEALKGLRVLWKTKIYYLIRMTLDWDDLRMEAYVIQMT